MQDSVLIKLLFSFSKTQLCILALSCLGFLALSASSAVAQPLQGQALSVTAELGGPGGLYSVGVEHLLVRTQTLQVGARLGASYADNHVWDGEARTITATAFATRRIGAIGEQPVALEAGVGASMVTATFDGSYAYGISSRREYYPYLNGALRVESSNGRFAYRLGAVLFSDDSEPFVLPLFSMSVGI